MKPFLKSSLIFLTGVLLAAGLLYFYADHLFDSPEGAEAGALPGKAAAARLGEAVITRISGEVYLIRGEAMLTPSPGDLLREGDVIKVVDDSFCQVHFAGTAGLRIRSNTLVRIRRLLSGSKDADIRTELLTGSMIYKVQELKAGENLEILAQDRIYRVEGTEFMLQVLPENRTALSVLSGRVALFSPGPEEAFLGALEARQSTVTSREDPAFETGPLSPADEALFREELPSYLPIEQEGLVFLQIAGRPEGAQIYLDGRLNGRTRVEGLFPAERELTVLLRKRGYRDETRRVVPGALEGGRLAVALTPLGEAETLEEESRRDDRDPVVEALRQRHREEKERLRSSFSRQLAAAEEETRLRERAEAELKREKSGLEEALAASREESDKLRRLIKQIQELAGEDG